ncbi:MAG TPA: ankyrin repeat domain-containing protein [Blastocatellia bacterium]|nr:ankyrin repeat domain-containing protein [Blastocatellia bacterium]
MTCLIAQTLVIFACLLSQPAQTILPDDPLTYTVKGRVVDNHGRPIANARVGLRVPEPQSPDVLASSLTDEEGRFSASESSSAPTDKATLYVIAPPEDAHVVLDAMFGRFAYLGPSMRGRVVHFDGNQEVDVGDVSPQIRYGRVVIRLFDQEGAPLPPDSDRWSNLVLRVRDSAGDVVEASAGVTDAGKRRRESSLILALPEGKWSIEVGVFGDAYSWNPLDRDLEISASGDPLEASVKLSGRNCVEDATKSSLPPEAARRELTQMGVTYSAEEFIERAGKGNARVVRLFLAAGMDPNARDKSGRTALIAAAGPYPGHADILCILLNHGADVNAKDDEGKTALINAAGLVNSHIMQVLLNRGADVNAQTNNGWTPLMIAAQAGLENTVTVLLDAGADVSLRNKDGKTSLDVAFRGNRVVSLLEKSLHRD